MKLTEEIKRILKTIKGSVVAFGFKTDKFEKILELNKNITSFDVLDEVSRKKEKLFGRSKKIGIKDLKRKYKKKGVDIIIINTDIMDKHLIYLIKETIYIGKLLYIYGNKEKVLKALTKYKRYNITYEEVDFKENLLVKIDISKSKNNKFKDNLYILKDKLTEFLNLLTDFLTS